MSPPHPLWRYASPAHFLTLTGRLLPLLWVAAALGIGLGLTLGLFIAPTDAQQGEAYRILYLHVPAAWIAMVCYAAMAFWALWGLAWKTRLAFVLMRSLAPTGALFAVLTLLTGSLWGRPTWGAWWVWDARLTSALLLALLYIGFIALTSAVDTPDDPKRGDQAGALLALVGALNLPVLYFSVSWWNTLHQGASISTRGSAIAPEMLAGLLLSTLGFWSYAGAAVLRRARRQLQARVESEAHWPRALGSLA
ncbi:heme exporter protein C [Pelomonas saccharophila]|uniref:Heme exporter protein C n=1 Tax=Roseateles saccharophilus TaxID=304 RepID=A0ABU1YUS7_ROSSA|nr:heme ABC transporter permease CcmC [Roseateles saccharophilus]MDR7272624.1 heme exporter protein C [Roseateles saccharophilus]